MDKENDSNHNSKPTKRYKFIAKICVKLPKLKISQVKLFLHDNHASNSSWKFE